MIIPDGPILSLYQTINSNKNVSDNSVKINFSFKANLVNIRMYGNNAALSNQNISKYVNFVSVKCNSLNCTNINGSFSA